MRHKGTPEHYFMANFANESKPSYYYHMNPKISMREKVGYSPGDVAANLVFQMMMIFQLKFYTDIFGLDGAVAGSVLLIARVADAFIDPLAGILSDRTQTRWGKYRPWVLWTALPFCVFYMLAFYNPSIEDKTMVAVYATVSYVLLMTMYSFNNTPYSSLGGVMTGDIKERTSITSIRFVGSTIAQFVVQGLTLPLVSRFGNGDDRMGVVLHREPLCRRGVRLPRSGLLVVARTHHSSAPARDEHTPRRERPVGQCALARHVRADPLRVHHAGLVGQCHELLLPELRRPVRPERVPVPLRLRHGCQSGLFRRILPVQHRRGYHPILWCHSVE